MYITERKKDRFTFLKRIFERSNGSSTGVFQIDKIGAELGFDRDKSTEIAQYLINEDLLEPYGLGGTITLTHLGIKEMEEALENPDEPTEHFLPINIINIGTMTNSSLQQGTTSSTINVNLDSNKLNDLSQILESLKNVQDILGISVDLHKELVSEIQTLQIQKESPKPKSIIIKESLKTIRGLLENVSANIISSPIIEQITKFMHNGL